MVDLLSADAGLLAVRLMVGLILMAHGTKLALRPLQPPKVVSKLGLRPPVLWAAMVWGSQIGGGLLLALGLAMPLGSALVVAPMAVAVASKWHNGYWNGSHGYEYPLVLAVLAVILGIAGPGSYAFDAGPGLAAALRPLTALLSMAVLAVSVVVAIQVYRLADDQYEQR